MADRETWARRVAEWKASGLSSPAFCAGKEFTAGGLRHWSHRLRHGDHPGGKVRLAKVVRLTEAPPPIGGERAAAAAAAALVVEIGAARIAVRPGFDRATLTAVVELLARARSAR